MPCGLISHCSDETMTVIIVGVPQLDGSAALVLLLFYASAIVIPVVGIVAFVVAVKCIVRKERPSGILISSVAALIVIPLFWSVVIRFDIDQTAVVLALVAALTAALLAPIVMTARLGPTPKRHVRELATLPPVRADQEDGRP